MVRSDIKRCSRENIGPIVYFDSDSDKLKNNVEFFHNAFYYNYLNMASIEECLQSRFVDGTDDFVENFVEEEEKKVQDEVNYDINKLVKSSLTKLETELETLKWLTTI